MDKLTERGGKYHLQITPSVLARWRSDEEASYGDLGEPETHTYVILGRYKGKLEFHRSESRQLLESAIHFSSLANEPSSEFKPYANALFGVALQLETIN